MSQGLTAKKSQGTENSDYESWPENSLGRKGACCVILGKELFQAGPQFAHMSTGSRYLPHRVIRRISTCNVL